MELEQPSAYFLHAIHWASTPSFYRSYITSIMTSISGLEQRSLLNRTVKRQFTYETYTRNQVESYHLKKYLKAYLHLVWGVPIWMYEMTLTASADVSDSVLNVVSTSYRELSLDDYVLLYSDYKTYEVVQIQGISASQLNVSPALSDYWEIGTKVYPILRSTIESAQEIKANVPGIFGIRMHFTESFRGYAYL